MTLALFQIDLSTSSVFKVIKDPMYIRPSLVPCCEIVGARSVAMVMMLKYSCAMCHFAFGRITRMVRLETFNCLCW